jgi:hypothetical protein
MKGSPERAPVVWRLTRCVSASHTRYVSGAPKRSVELGASIGCLRAIPAVSVQLLTRAIAGASPGVGDAALDSNSPGKFVMMGFSLRSTMTLARCCASVGLISLPLGLARGQVSTATPPVVELRGGHWFTGTGFATGSRFMRGERLVARPAAPVDSVIRLDGLWMVPPYGDAHTHSPDGGWDIESIRDFYLTQGVFYTQVLTNHRSGRLSLHGKVNVPTSIDAQFADGAVTSTGGHPQLLYESLALFRRPWVEAEADRQRAARSTTQDGDVYHRLDSLPQLPALIARLRRDTLAILKLMVIGPDDLAVRALDSTTVGLRGLDRRVIKPLVDSAHAMGRQVWAHVDTRDDFEAAAAAGVDAFAHVPGYGAAAAPDSTLVRMRLTDASVRLLRGRRVLMTPTLGLTADTAWKDSAAFRRMQTVAVANVRMLARAGVRMLHGSDTYSSVEAINNDVRALGDALRLTPAQRLTLRAVTTPQAIFPQRRIGAFTPGFEASALALTCNPLRDLSCQTRIARRLKQGMWLSLPPAKD